MKKFACLLSKKFFLAEALSLILGFGLSLSSFAQPIEFEDQELQSENYPSFVDQIDFENTELSFLKDESSQSLDHQKLDKVDCLNKDQHQGLQILGKGIHKKQSDQSLALACEDAACSSLRFVYFHDRSTACFIGDRILAPESINGSLKTKATRLLVSAYMDFHFTSASLNRSAQAGRTKGFIRFVGVGSATGLATVLLSPVSFLGAIPVAVGIAGYYLVTSKQLGDFLVGAHQTQLSFSDQKGWNWSIQPKEIKAKKFNEIVNLIVNGKDFSHHASDQRLDRNVHHRNVHRFEKKRNKLISKGVRFPDQTWTVGL